MCLKNSFCSRVPHPVAITFMIQYISHLHARDSTITHFPIFSGLDGSHLSPSSNVLSKPWDREAIMLDSGLCHPINVTTLSQSDLIMVLITSGEQLPSIHS